MRFLPFGYDSFAPFTSFPSATLGLNRARGVNRTELARWLQSDYNLNAAEVAMVLGTSIRYDVADLVGRQVSIVAKFSKPVLTQLNQE